MFWWIHGEIIVDGIKLKGKDLHKWALENDPNYAEYIQELETKNAETAKKLKQKKEITNKKIGEKLNIERYYYTIKELAEYWQVSSNEIMQLGLTGRLQFDAFVNRHDAPLKNN